MNHPEQNQWDSRNLRPSLRCSHKGTVPVQGGEAASGSDVPGPRVPPASLVTEGSGHTHTRGKRRLAFNTSRETLTTHTHTHTHIHTHTHPRGSGTTETCIRFQKSPPHEGLAQALRMESRCFCCRNVWRVPRRPHLSAPQGST